MSKETQIHVQLGEELFRQVQEVTEKDPILNTKAAFVRQAVVDLLEKRRANETEREFGKGARRV